MSHLLFMDQRLAIGLSWLAPGFYPNGMSTSRKERALLKQKPPPVGYVEIKTRDGIQTGQSFDETHSGYPAAAAILAQEGSALVLVEPIDENLYWLCAVESGAVWPAGDITGTRNQIRTRLQEIMQDMVEPSVYDPARQFEIETSDPVGFDDLVNELPADLQITPLPKTIISKPLRWGSAVASVVAVILAGWFLYVDRFSTEPAVDPSKQHDVANRQKEYDRIEHVLQQDPVRLLFNVINTVFARPLRSGGWRQAEYEWTNNSLKATWINERGTIGSLTETLPPGSWTMDTTGTRILETIELLAPQKEPTVDLDRLFEHASRYRFIDELASLSGRWLINAAESEGTHYKVSRSVVNASKLSADTSINSVTALAESPFRITRLKWALDRKFEMSLEGEFYEPHG